MMHKLKSVSMISIVTNSLIGVSLLTLPRDIATYAHSDAWISVLIVGLITFLNAYGFYWVAITNPTLNFSQINEKILGKFLGRVVMIVIGIYGSMVIGLSLRLFSESISIFLLENTPRQVISVVIMVAVLYCLKTDIKSISIVLDFLLPVLLLFILMLILLSIKGADFKNIFPIFSGGITPIIKGSLHAVDPILACGTIAYVMPYFEHPKTTKKWVFWGVGIGMSIYLFIMLLCIWVFGENEVQHLLFPTLTLSKSIQLQSQIFERAESIFMAVWIPNTFATLLLFYFFTTLNLKAFFKTKKNNLIIYAQLPIFFIIESIPKDIPDLFRLLALNNKLAIWLNFGYFPVFILITALKQRRKSP